MTKSHYLTVRCQECECWLHPRAINAHRGRCPRRPWIDAVADSTLVTGDMAELLTRLLPPELVDRPTFSDDRMLSPGPGEYLREEVCHGIVVRSPVDGVRSRRWTHVAGAAFGAGGETELRRTLTAEGFGALENELVLDVVVCPTCGELLKDRGLGTHRRTNAACRFRQAVTEVRDKWSVGFRDPWSIPGAPLEWGALKRRAIWSKRLHVVTFPRWAAVLLAPISSSR